LELLVGQLSLMYFHFKLFFHLIIHAVLLGLIISAENIIHTGTSIMFTKKK
jgi:hypothetical protein